MYKFDINTAPFIGKYSFFWKDYKSQAYLFSLDEKDGLIVAPGDANNPALNQLFDVYGDLQNGFVIEATNGSYLGYDRNTSYFEANQVKTDPGVMVFTLEANTDDQSVCITAFTGSDLLSVYTIATNKISIVEVQKGFKPGPDARFGIKLDTGARANPTSDQITHTQSNLDNIIALLNHLHDFGQDAVNDVFSRVSEDPVDNPNQKWVTNLFDAAFWSLGGVEFKGSAVISSFLGTFFGAYALPDSPPSLSGTFAGIWERCAATFLQANLDLAIIHDDVKGNWNKKFTNPVTGNDACVYELGDSTVEMPAFDQVLFQQLTMMFYNGFKCAIAKETLHLKWYVSQYETGNFYEGSEDNIIKEIKEIMKDGNKGTLFTYRYDPAGPTGSFNTVPEYWLIQNDLKAGHLSFAPDDLCDWLFHDDGYGTVTNKIGLAPRKEVFFNWGLTISTSGFGSGNATGEQK